MPLGPAAACVHFSQAVLLPAPGPLDRIAFHMCSSGTKRSYRPVHGNTLNMHIYGSSIHCNHEHVWCMAGCRHYKLQYQTSVISCRFPSMQSRHRLNYRRLSSSASVRALTCLYPAAQCPAVSDLCKKVPCSPIVYNAHCVRCINSPIINRWVLLLSAVIQKKW